MIALFWSIELITSFMDSVVGCCFSMMFIKNKEDSLKEKIIVYSLFSSAFIIIFNKINLFSFLNGVIGIIVLYVLQCILYKQKYTLLTLLTIAFAVIDSAIDFIVAQMGAIALNLDVDYILNTQCVERCICGLISKLILCICIYSAYKYHKHIFDIPQKYTLIICLISIIFMAINYYIIDTNSKTNNSEIRVFSVVFFLISITLILVILNLILKLAENYQQKQDIALLELQNDMLINSERNTEHAFNLWRSSIHDYKHKIIAIKHWLDEDNIKQVKQFIEKENESLTQKVFYIKTGNDVVDAIINTKQRLAEEKGIIFSVSITMPSPCRISDIDIVCILGNLIDNAIEACAAQNKKYIDIVAKKIKNKLMIKVINSYQNDLPAEMITTKKEKTFHGIGLKNVKNIVDKYGGTFEIIKEKDEVIAEIMVINN